MLGKLLKHEFRATGRTMLPIYGALLILSVLANLSIRFFDVTDITFLRIMFTIIIVLFFMGIAAACVVTLVNMIARFYRDLLGPQGYLTNTLPVSVHAQMWSKLIVSLAWFAVTFLIIWLVILLTGLIQAGTGLGELMIDFPSREELRQLLAEAGIKTGSLTLFGFECLLSAVVYCLMTCLHFYASITLGHSLAKNKVLMSIVIFIGISFVFSMFNTSIGVAQIKIIEGAETALESSDQVLGLLRSVLFRGILVQLVQGSLLYLATVLGLKKGLNLA